MTDPEFYPSIWARRLSHPFFRLLVCVMFGLMAGIVVVDLSIWIFGALGFSMDFVDRFTYVVVPITSIAIAVAANRMILFVITPPKRDANAGPE